MEPMYARCLFLLYRTYIGANISKIVFWGTLRPNLVMVVGVIQISKELDPFFTNQKPMIDRNQCLPIGAPLCTGAPNPRHIAGF